jgi:hypothetical protein
MKAPQLLLLLGLAAAFRLHAQSNSVRLDTPAFTDSALLLTLRDATNTAQLIETSSNLADWRPWLIVASATPATPFRDSTAPLEARRFYRARNVTGMAGWPTVDLRNLWSHGTAVGQGPVRFTHPPMALADVSYIVPLGLTVSSHVTPVDHFYFSPATNNTLYDVRAPAGGHVVWIKYLLLLGSGSDVPQFTVVIEHTGTFWSYYGLINELDPAIESQAAAQAGPPVTNGPPRLVRFPVAAGQRLGGVIGRTLDMGIANGELLLGGLLVPSHYDGEGWKIHTVDLFDHYDEPLRSQMLAKNPRTALPRGGRIDYDVDGRAVGNWFKLGTGYYNGGFMNHLSLTYYHIDPAQIVVSLGNFNGAPRQFWVIGNGPDPVTITTNTPPVKYELHYATRGSYGQPFPGIDTSIKGTLLVQLIEPRLLRAESFPGMTASQVTGFSTNAALYER